VLRAEPEQTQAFSMERLARVALRTQAAEAAEAVAVAAETRARLAEAQAAVSSTFTTLKTSKAG
jgi:hypothetical protein